MVKTSREPSVLVTGASRGLGHHMAAHLAEQGWGVYGGVRSEDAAAALAQQSDGRITPLRLDVTDPDQVRTALERVQDDVGDQGLGGLVNNAGIAPFGPVEQTPIGDVEHTLQVNVLGPVALTRAAMPLLRRGGGRIVNISSINGVLPSPFAAAYSASKAALELLSDALRLELKPWGIPVVVVRPGPYDTDVRRRGVEDWRRRREQLPPDERSLYQEGFETQDRFMDALDQQAGHPDEVAETVHRALTDPDPQPKYSVGPGMDDLLALASLPDTEREEALMQAVSSMLDASPA